MTFPSRSRLFAQLGQLGRIAPLAFVLALTTLAVAGCENKHIGRLCDLGVSDDGGTAGTGTTATINSEALECPSRICLLPGNEQGANTASLCTAECSSDDDCSDGETTSDPNNVHCKSSFVCTIPTTVGDFCCRKMCVCKDFLIMPTTGGFGQVPAVCMSAAGGCKNVH
jgi:hypothetical protein